MGAGGKGAERGGVGEMTHAGKQRAEDSERSRKSVTV